METVKEKKEVEQENLELREQTEEDDKMENICDSYYKLQKSLK